MYRVVLRYVADSRWRISEKPRKHNAYYTDYQLLIQDLGLKDYLFIDICKKIKLLNDI